jgi:hypothetical protein
MFESFNIDYGELVEAFLSEKPCLENQILERLSDEMSAKEYTRLIQTLEVEAMYKDYPFLEGKR